MKYQLPKVDVCTDLQSSDYDAIVVVSSSVGDLPFELLKTPLQQYAAIDASAEKGVFVVPSSLPCKRIVFSGTGALENDYDDVRWLVQL